MSGFGSRAALFGALIAGTAWGQVFGPAAIRPAGRLPSAVAVADFDGRLGPDIAITNVTDGTVAVFFARGDGTYDPAATVAAIAVSDALLSLDADQDGSPDLVTTSQSSGARLAVLLGNGDGTFSVSTYATTSFAGALATADFDRDGKPDLAGANEIADSVTIFRGSGTGIFTATGTYTVGDNPVAIAAADLDLTNGPDVAVAHTGGTDGVTVLLNGGSGLLGSPVEYAVTAGGNPAAIRVVDVDQSLGPDLLVADAITRDFAVLLATGNGQFAPAVAYPVPGSGSPTCLAIADADGDGDIDAIVGLESAPGVSVLVGNGAGSFGSDPSSPYTAPLAVRAIAMADVDFDGAPEGIAALGDTAAPNATGSVAIFGNLLGAFGPVVTTTTLPNAAVNQAYGATLSATGGTPPYTWSLASGGLPFGMTLDTSTGAISGTPSLTGTVYFTAKVLDAALEAGIRPLSLRVVSPASVLAAKGPGPASSYNQILAGYEADGTPIPALSFPAFSLNGYGTRLGGGDLFGDEVHEILAMPGPGPTHPPAVRGFHASGVPIATVDYFAYGVLAYGGNVSAADVDDVSFSEILTGPGPGPAFGPQVRGWSYDGSSQPQGLTKVNYYAYGTLNYGVSADALDADADGYAEILTGAGPGPVFGPHVRGWNYDGTVLASMPGLSFFAYSTLKYGVNAVGGELDGDARGEILTGPGPGSVFGAHLRGFQYAGTVSAIGNISAFVFGTRYGLDVAAADVEADGFSEIVVGPGPDPAASSSLRAFDYDATGLTPIPALSIDPFALSYGLRVAGLPLGY